MDDLISRQDAADFLCDWCGICSKEKRNIMECDDIAPNFAKIPSAQKKGHWIFKREEHSTYTAEQAVCSECGEPCATYGLDKPRDRFCKWCGADMRGEEDR